MRKKFTFLIVVLLLLGNITAWGQTYTWNLVTDTSSLQAGDVVVIACNTEGKTAGDITDNVMSSITSTFNNDYSQITSLEATTIELTLGVTSGAWTLANSSGQLLGATKVKELAWDSGTTTWNISIADNNVTIQNETLEYGNMQHYDRNPRFTTYTSNQTPVQLYKKTQSGSSTYTITYNCNNGTSNCPENTTSPAGNYTLASAPSRTCHTFLGWNDGTTTYNAGDTYSITGNVVFTAQWSQDTYNIVYHANGGTGNDYSDSKTCGTDYTVLDYTDASFTAPAATPHFAGWATTAEGNVAHIAGGNYSNDADLDLYAKWSATTYTVTLNPGTGSVDPTSLNGITVDLSTVTVTPPTDWTFFGWTTSPVEETTITPAIINGTYTLTGNVTLYAVYSKSETSGSLATTLDLSTSTQITTCEESTLVFTETPVTLTVTRVGSNTAANNFCPCTDKTSTRFYSGNNSVIDAGSNAMSNIVFTATTAGFAEKLCNSAWTNATTSVNGEIVTVTPTSNATSVSFIPTEYCGVSSIAITHVGSTTTYNSNPITSTTPTITASIDDDQLNFNPTNNTSSVGTITIEGANLSSNDIIVSLQNGSSSGFEYSTDGVSYSTTVPTSLTLVDGSVVMYVRMNSSSADDISAGIIFTGDNGTVTSEALTFTGTTLIAYTITIDPNIIGGQVTASATQAVAGAQITLEQNANTGYSFISFSVTDASENPITVTGNTFTMPESNVTVTATFVQPFSYSLVTNVSQLNSGATYIITNGKSGSVNAMGLQKEDNRGIATVSEAGETIALTPASSASQDNAAFEFILGVSNDKWTFYDILNSGYLYAASSSSNYLKIQSTNNANGEWNITFDTDDNATVQSTGTNSRNIIRYNSTSELFSCYNSGQKDIFLYVKNEIKQEGNNYTVYGKVSAENLTIAATETYTIKGGAVLTITGTLTNTTAANLIIEDGGQLIFNNSGVQATVEKNFITPTGTWTQDDATGWHFISSPVTSQTIQSFIDNAGENDYDLYKWDGSQQDENNNNTSWYNYKGDGNNFENNFTVGTGYLTAYESATQFDFTGELNFGTSYSFENLTYNADNGWENYALLGNPYTYAMDWSKFSMTNVFNGFAVVNPSTGAFDYATSGLIYPGQGFMIYTQETSPTLSYDKNGGAKRDNSVNEINVFVEGQESHDNTIIRLGKNEKGGFAKLTNMNRNMALVYLPVNGVHYAIASFEEDTESIPVSFKAKISGLYTFSVKLNGKFAYLHLIDNLTGADIDLLKENSYSFMANTNDYASRFKLVLNPIENGPTSGENFAFFSNGNLIINSIENGAILQVIDIQGHILSNETVNGSYNKALNMNAGIYVIRLIESDNVRIQKIVVE
jgi:Listeria-Bacteroides repeat domain (List_Bact_rpt).